RRVREVCLPGGDADFAHINVTARIERKAVRREELAGVEARPLLPAEPRDTLALRVHNRQAGPEIRDLEVDWHARAEFADNEVRLLPATAVERAGPMQVVPLRLEFAVAVEHLHAVVLAIRDIDPAVLVGGDVVHDVELAGIGARLAPGH